MAEQQSHQSIKCGETFSSDFSVEIPFRVAHDLTGSGAEVPPEDVAIIGAALHLLFPAPDEQLKWQILSRAEQMQRLS